MTEAPPVVGEEGAASPPERGKVPTRILEFFFFPLVMVAVGVGVFVLFGLITTEGKRPRDYVSLIRSGDSNRRWQAAFELSKVIGSGKDARAADPRLVGDMVSLFKDAEGDDPRVRRFLALALGRLGDSQAVPTLLEYVKGVRRGEGNDPETHVYAVWALGAIGDQSAVPELVALAGHDDPGLRKTAVHALGAFRSADATAALQTSLGDAVGDVRWNAAAALAHRGDLSAVPVLEEMLDRERLGRGSEGMTSEQTEEILLQAVAGAAFLHDPRLDARLTALSSDDPSLKVRAAARRGLERKSVSP